MTLFGKKGAGPDHGDGKSNNPDSGKSPTEAGAVLSSQVIDVHLDLSTEKFKSKFPGLERLNPSGKNPDISDKDYFDTLPKADQQVLREVLARMSGVFDRRFDAATIDLADAFSHPDRWGTKPRVHIAKDLSSEDLLAPGARIVVYWDDRFMLSGAAQRIVLTRDADGSLRIEDQTTLAVS